jgi:hypothetical protein
MGPTELLFHNGFSCREHRCATVHGVGTYQIQGRRTEWGADGKVRNVVRLESAGSRTVAFAIAEAMAAENLKAWVFRADRESGRWRYRLLGVVPDPDAGRLSGR